MITSRQLALVLTLTGILAAGGGTAAPASVAAGDLAWQRRAEGAAGLRAAPGPIAEAIAEYEAALEQRPDDLEAVWKLMRALFYRGRYVLEDAEAKSQLYLRARDLGEAAIGRLAERAGIERPLDKMEVEEIVAALAGQPQAAPIFYWTGAHWGLWGELSGKLAAVRQGVATRVRDYASIVIGLDETYDSGGAYRVLGRLHFEAPRVPFVTGWVDRETALRSLERAVELGPAEPMSELYLAEALYEYDHSRRQEAVRRLERLIEQGPRPDHPVEDGRTLESARNLLSQWKR